MPSPGLYDVAARSAPSYSLTRNPETTTGLHASRHVYKTCGPKTRAQLMMHDSSNNAA